MAAKAQQTKDVEFYSGAWQRFEHAMDAVAKASALP
jgi:hypothetical protein